MIAAADIDREGRGRASNKRGEERKYMLRKNILLLTKCGVRGKN